MVDNTIKLENKKSLRFELQHLFNKDDKKNWYGYGLEYNFNFNFSAYYNNIVNYQNIEDDKPSYYSFGTSYAKILLDFHFHMGNKEVVCCVMVVFADMFLNLKGFHFQ